MTKMTLASSIFRGIPIIWTKTKEAITLSALVVATAMMIRYAVHLMANAVHLSGVPEVQHRLHSTPDG